MAFLVGWADSVLHRKVQYSRNHFTTFTHVCVLKTLKWWTRYPETRNCKRKLLVIVNKNVTVKSLLHHVLIARQFLKADC
jgi:hypothetical protein